jgi:glycosyltransferase involved in cell wall biosynthesis
VYEGFGIPILEAMAAEVPMVLSDLHVFREITNNTGIFFNPHDFFEIATSIEKLYNSKDIQNNIINFGIKRIEDFSYTNIAKNVISLYYK